MFGVFFLNHPDLRRILSDYNFQGYPLKKDFPLSGFREVIYSNIENRLLYKKVKLDQEYRHFIYNSNLIKKLQTVTSFVFVVNKDSIVPSIESGDKI
jgi:hypothetical protein